MQVNTTNKFLNNQNYQSTTIYLKLGLFFKEIPLMQFLQKVSDY